MPLVRIDIIEGQSRQYQQKLLDVIYHAMVKWIGLPKGDRRQILTEHSPANFEHKGRSDFYTVIEVTLIKGRNFETKKCFYREVVGNLSQELNIPPNDITIILNEQPAENWGIRGGIPASEIFGNFVDDNDEPPRG
jgi:phenylpyruvate tautomerase PptA (4-oxalocrotonate tautomerase family)